ncbi:MAG: hypothetical protein GY941_22570 [Planctomycetes bacterium]|nr:hypothetical protein [Planctomycetota bacterium]
MSKTLKLKDTINPKGDFQIVCGGCESTYERHVKEENIYGYSTYCDGCNKYSIYTPEIVEKDDAAYIKFKTMMTFDRSRDPKVFNPM